MDFKIENTDVYILGAVGFGRELEVWLSKSDDFNRRYIVRGHLDDQVDALYGYPTDFVILGKISDYSFKVEDRVLLAISEPELKISIVQNLERKV